MGSSKPLPLRARDFLRYRSRPVRGWLEHRVWRRLVPFRPGRGPLKLHLGSGKERLEGWVNVDLQALPEVDRALDVTRGLPYSGAARVYAEHFLEHLAVDAAVDFLVEVRRSLAPDGWFRLSTPNLDWVWARVAEGAGAVGEDAEERWAEAGILANRAFYGWRHRFLWNRPLLERALAATGFDRLRWCRHGESSIDDFRGVERHETYPDSEEVPHVLIAEATVGRERPEKLESFRERLRREFLRYLDAP